MTSMGTPLNSARHLSATCCAMVSALPVTVPYRIRAGLRGEAGEAASWRLM